MFFVFGQEFEAMVVGLGLLGEFVKGINRSVKWVIGVRGGCLK